MLAGATLSTARRLQARESGEELFSACLPEKKDLINEAETQRVFRLFRELMSLGSQLKAPPGQVFELMVFKGHGQNETARLCKCAPSLITRRVATIESHFGISVEQLRNYATVLTEMDRSVKGQRYAKKKHGPPKEEPGPYDEADEQTAKEDGGGYLPEERQDGT